LKEKKLSKVRDILKEHMLKTFLELSWNIYPDLVRVFYTNLQIVGDNICSHVKEVDMEIIREVWTANVGLKINKGNI